MSFLFCKSKKFAVGFAVFVFIFFGVLPDSALAVLYQPGETLNPLCAPTDINCGVILITGGNIIPDVNNVYDLGSPTRQWRDLYLSGNTLHLGGLSLSAGASTGALVWSGSSIETTPSATSTSEFKLSELVANGANYTGFKSPDMLVANSLYTLPSADGAGGQTLSTNGSGVLSWVTREPAITIGAITQYYRGDKTFQTLDTSAVPENGNLYYTDTRVRNALSASAPISYSTSTGVFSLATGNITAPSNPEFTITGGTGAVMGSGLTFAMPEASATTRGLVSTTIQIFAGDKTFSSSLTLSPMTQGSLLFAGAGGLVSQNNSNLFWDNTNNRLGIGTNTPAGAIHAPSASNANAFIVTNDGSVGIGTIPDATKQFHVKFDADKGALFDGRTNPRVVTVGVVRFEHTAGAEGTKPVFYDIDAAGFANTHATEVTYKTGAMTGISNVHDIEIDGTNANGAIVHGLQIDVINSSGLGKVIGLGTDPHTDPIEQHTGTYLNDTQSWYYNLSTYTNITAGTQTIFNVDESYVYVGADTAFSSIQANLAVAANQNINPVFTYWNGSAWAIISPSDGTNGLTNSGVISIDGLTSGWSATSVNGVSKYYIQIRRTRNSLNTSPQLASFLTNNAIDFYWDKTGKLKINTIETTGNVGIGTSTPGYLLTMGTGGGYYNQSTGAWVNGSDRAYKDNILDLGKYGLETVKSLRPVSYIVKESGAPQIGFIAQEVKEIVPEIVSGEDGAMGVNYGGFTPILVKAVQEIASLADSFKHSLVVWFADTTNGITDFFAKKIHTEQICLKKADGSEYCVNGDDLEMIMRASLEAKAQNYGSSTSIIESQGSESTDIVAPISNILMSDVDNINNTAESSPIETAPTETALEITSLSESLPVITGATITE